MYQLKKFTHIHTLAIFPKIKNAFIQCSYYHQATWLEYSPWMSTSMISRRFGLAKSCAIIAES
jgi:hypothetical protein